LSDDKNQNLYAVQVDGLISAIMSAAGLIADCSKYSNLLDLFSSCAEDNALIKLNSVLAVKCNQRKLTGVKTEWMACQYSDEDKKLYFKHLCDFCEVRFQEKLEHVISKYI